MYRDGNSGTICWHCGLPGDKKFYRLYPKSGPNTKSHEVIQFALHEIYGHNYIEDNTAKDDMVCPECRNSIMSFTKCYKRLFDIKRCFVEKGHHSREKRPLPATPSMSPTKQPLKKIKTATLKSPLVQVC